MTLFEYIITNLFKNDESEIKQIVNNSIKKLYVYDFAETLRYSNYLKRNDEQSKQLLDILFSIMFRIMKEDMKDSFYNFIKKFNKVSNVEFYKRMNLFNSRHDFYKICTINYAFDWNSTKEHFQFWRDINRQVENKFLDIIFLSCKKNYK